MKVVWNKQHNYISYEISFTSLVKGEFEMFKLVMGFCMCWKLHQIFKLTGTPGAKSTEKKAVSWYWAMQRGCKLDTVHFIKCFRTVIEVTAKMVLNE